MANSIKLAGKSRDQENVNVVEKAPLLSASDPRYCPICHTTESYGFFTGYDVKEWIRIEGQWYHLDCVRFN